MTHTELAKYIREQKHRVQKLPVITGFDGFVDELISVVNQRHSLTHFQRIETIENFSETIGAAAGHSSLREIVVKTVDPGGCAINLGDGLAEFGIPVSTYATVGEPIHSAFTDYSQKVQLTSWGRAPGKTLAFEFADGKLMFSSVSHLQEFTPERLRHYLKDGHFFENCYIAAYIAITDWTLFPHMTDCWEFLLETVFSKLEHTPKIFFDLVDPSSRSVEDIKKMLTVLTQYSEYCHVTLGLNQNEINVLSSLTNGRIMKAKSPEDALVQAQDLQSKLNIDAVIVHSLRYAVGCEGDQTASMNGPYCEKPVKSTGAGDRFNAGYILGCLIECSLADRLTLATATSGYFVRQAKSPTIEELAQFIETMASS
ncbi:PfkB family carbohydrate kinase [Cerasicoccus frondis]|uniref:PfkB family carbohydrate kinase n=1 Tax=Cerasicoccus frondis TaxID=490090 RepID=UPI0028524BE1|nr:PfkB family carbohydrate kinase [Cerasicoccus frondis]